MTEISLEAVARKLNAVGYNAFDKADRLARASGNPYVEVVHLLLTLVHNEKSDISVTLDKMKADRAKVITELTAAVNRLPANKTGMPDFSAKLKDFLNEGWYHASLMFGDDQIRSGHLLVGGLNTPDTRNAIQNASRTLAALDAQEIHASHRALWADSEEHNLRSLDAKTDIGGAKSADSEAKGPQTALDKFSVDMTAQAVQGKIDKVVGRDDEIRQIIDILSRRRQNNPILTGEAGVGKTAVVEGFAHKIASGDVPPHLKGVRLLALDIGLMQAGASLRGEFEQRLRAVIDEVQSSPVPIILFIDEAHTLIGAGGAQGTGDAANLLKPALARGTLRTIGATTWAEYRQYFEKDPALTRRFQPIQVGEPGVEVCCDMLRGIIEQMEKHHRVRISDEAIVSAVQLSRRYIPARQLPDKAVSLLDTASAKVAISQATTPAAIEDLRRNIEARERERAALEREVDLGNVNSKRVEAVGKQLLALNEALETLTAKWDRERSLIEGIMELRLGLAERRQARKDAPAEEVANADGEPSNALAGGDAELETQLAGKIRELDGIAPEDRMMYPHVDGQAVGAVVSAWTGIPVGRMVKDEVEAIIRLPEVLNRRVLGQSHALEMIARRIESSRAKLVNPNKPIGVFMLAGPSGVGKTETALALAEALYGGEQNMITINMSEFQEAHTVSTLKGAPPGYVGYGEGGRLTEAVRRRPYSVVLLDEIEKAHPDVHEIFFQVFDKGVMEDGTGRQIDFKNTLIILTSNVGTDLIMHMAEGGRSRPDPEQVTIALRPHLQEVFPPALLGRIVTIPYYPLSKDKLDDIVRLQLSRVGQRIAENHEAVLTYDDAVVSKIVDLCTDIDSGGRMIDNIITNSLLPEMSRRILTLLIAKQKLETIHISLEDGQYSYSVQSRTAEMAD